MCCSAGATMSPRIDVVLCIVDASNLERNLYLVSQVLELGLPTVVALNMVDVAEGKGLTLDIERLRKQLPVPVVARASQSRHRPGRLKEQLAAAAQNKPHTIASPFPDKFCQEVAGLSEHGQCQRRPAAAAVSGRAALLDTSGYLATSGAVRGSDALAAEVSAARSRLAAAGLPVPAVEAMARYGWAGKVLTGVVTRPAQRKVTLSDRIDRVLTHRIWGTLIFVALMLLLFQAVFYVAEPASQAIDWLNGTLSDLVIRFTSEGALRSLLTKA